MALIFGLRIRGALDHVGRPDPPFSHGIAAIDRALDGAALLAAITAFHRRVIGDGASDAWYRSYARLEAVAPAKVANLLARYVASFRDLPRPDPSSMSLAWTTDGAQRPGRVVFVHKDDAQFEAIAGGSGAISISSVGSSPGPAKGWSCLASASADSIRRSTSRSRQRETSSESRGSTLRTTLVTGGILPVTIDCASPVNGRFPVNISNMITPSDQRSAR